jgi:hypothetical protein
MGQGEGRRKVQEIFWRLSMLSLLKKFVMWIFTTRCPNCISAWTGGNPNPETITFCIVCSSPKTGKIRGWVWRWAWFNWKFVTDKNFKKLRKTMQSESWKAEANNM